MCFMWKSYLLVILNYIYSESVTIEYMCGIFQSLIVIVTFCFQPDCLDDLAYAIMYEMSKLCYRVSEADVTRACNQVAANFP